LYFSINSPSWKREAAAAAEAEAVPGIVPYVYSFLLIFHSNEKIHTNHELYFSINSPSWKRDAEAEAEAVPGIVPYVYSFLLFFLFFISMRKFILMTNCIFSINSPSWKREAAAEAEAEPEPEPLCGKGAAGPLCI
jgi:hypothetical protein